MLIVRRKISVKWNMVFFSILFLLLFILAYYNIIILENARPGKMLEKTIKNMEMNFSHLKVDIEERGLDYKISFEGKIAGSEIIYGEVPEYSLEIMKNNSDELFIKDLKDQLWKEASKIGLESLDTFFISPFKMLDSWTPLFKKAKFVNYQSEKEKVILLDVSPENIQKAGFFQAHSSEDFWLECLVFIEEDKLFIKQIIFSLYNKSNFDNIFNRVFSFTPYEKNDFLTVPVSITDTEINEY